MAVLLQTFKLLLSVPANDPLHEPGQLLPRAFDSKQYQGLASPDGSNAYSLSVIGDDVSNAVTFLPVGAHSVVAAYYSVQLQTTIESAPITLTVHKASTDLLCGAVTGGSTFAPGSPFTIDMLFSVWAEHVRAYRLGGRDLHSHLYGAEDIYRRESQGE